jgi:hypothetical protein
LHAAEYRNNSGWESDADLASDEQQLSPAGSDSDDEHAGCAALEHVAAAEQGGDASPHPSASQGSPVHLAPAQRALSDTVLNSDSDGPGSGTASDGSHGRPAGLTSASLLGGDPAGGRAMPALEHSLDAPLSPPAEEAAPPLQERSVGEEAGQAGARAPHDRAGSPHWKGLAPRPVVLKRAGQPAHQRLSPALVDGTALRLVEQPAGDQAAPAGEERAVPQQEP